MNSPVTHAECIQCMKELEERFHACLEEDKVDFKEALADVRNLVIRLEDKFDTLIKEVGVIGIGAFIAYEWGRL